MNFLSRTRGQHRLSGMTKTRIGRRRIFPGKPETRVQGVLVGGKKFEDARVRLRDLAAWKGPVSDADVIDYLAMGEAEARKVLGLS